MKFQYFKKMINKLKQKIKILTEMIVNNKINYLLKKLKNQNK